MLNVAKKKIHPLVRAVVDYPSSKIQLYSNAGWQAGLSDSLDQQGEKQSDFQLHSLSTSVYEKNRVPFIFLEKDGEIYAYVEMVDVQDDLTYEALLEHKRSLDTVGVLKDRESISLPFLFQTLGDPITLVKGESEKGKEEYIGYIRREDLLVELLKEEGNTTNLLKIMLASIPMGIFIVNTERKIINGNEAGLKMLKMTSENVMNQDARTIFNAEKVEKVFSSKKTLLNQIHVTDDLGVLFDYSPLVDENHEVEGIMIIVQDLPKVEEMAMEMEYVKDLNADLNAILTSLYDEILVVNHEGTILRYSDNFTYDGDEGTPQALVGKSIFDLEDEIGSTVARLVIERKKQASIVQETKTGKNVMATGNPVFDEAGALYRIVIASRDITETTKLKDELDATKRLTKEYKKELDTLKNKEEFGKKVIFRSLPMEKVMLNVEKLTEFHSTVLLLGESGVGKDLIANVIHQNGKRKNKPYLALNCGAIPEELLESELFGYVKGAFTGADQEGRMGYFEKAHEGVLFLDEISELPGHLQVKLLRVLQEKEITRVGSTETIPVDVQIITATNKDLKEQVKEGRFREDLYYRINVIPITIPPLRERPEDIPLLAFHFMEQLNKQYHKNYHLAPEALRLLEAYNWPGNIRELQNLMERIVVFADEDIITAEFISSFMHFGQKSKSKPIITDVIPFKEAQELLEEQLISLAMEQYKTTTKAAEALELNQSTVSRKYKRIMENRETK